MLNFTVCTFCCLLVFGCVAFSRDSGTGGAPSLVVYFSKSGNTRALAEYIQSETGAESTEITVVNPYPEEYHATTELAKTELANNARPEIQPSSVRIEDYETIYLGFPIWWGTAPMAVRTFLEQHDFSGKTIVPFVTHGGGGVSRAEMDLKTACPDATVLPALVVSGSSARNAQGQVTAWLKQLSLIQ